jgi:tRNA A-37 threonylcarbamoyl transferase component Bud32
MLQWSTEPLELYVDDERSPARRLPATDQQWLRETGAVLFVPVIASGSDASRQGADGSPRRVKGDLVALIALGARRSEEPYTAEDRQLLASIAGQMGLALDVARLRQRADLHARADVNTGGDRIGAYDTAGTVGAGRAGHSECPQCRLCAAIGVTMCPIDGTAMQRASVPHVIDGKYRIDQVIGRGGMGAVYRARDMRLDRDVAIKVVRAELLDDPEARTRFRREAQIVARLQHPAIVAVFDYGTFADGSAFLVMELVRGDDLRHLLRHEGSLTVDRALPLLTALCGAVDAAHREGVLHRDLKPENILLVKQDSRVKVLDFGVAKVVSDRAAGETAVATLTSAGVIVGTPAYMAPEQLRSEPLDARTDVFSLGVIAYEMLTGELPFGRASLWDIGLQQLGGVKPMRGVPAGVEATIKRALSLNPSERPSSAADFARALTTAP